MCEQISRNESARSLDSRNGTRAEPSSTAYKSLRGSMGADASEVVDSSGECFRFRREFRWFEPIRDSMSTSGSSPLFEPVTHRNYFLLTEFFLVFRFCLYVTDTIFPCFFIILSLFYQCLNFWYDNLKERNFFNVKTFMENTILDCYTYTIW